MSSNNDENDEQLKKTLKQKELSEAQKTIAENQKAIAEAQKATLEAYFPKGKLEPQEGTVTTNGKFGYISQLVAYESMMEKAKKISNAIKIKLKDETTKSILIVDKLDVASLDTPLIQVESTIELLKNKIQSQKKANDDFLSSLKPKKVKALVLAPVLAATLPIIIPSVIGSIADIIGYFKTDYDIKGQEFSLENQALVALVAGALDDFPVYIYNFNLLEATKFSGLKSFNETLDQKIELDKSKDLIQSLIDKNEIVDPKRLEEAKTIVENSKSISDTFTTFADTITKTSDENVLPLLFKAALRKYIQTLGITHLLYLKIVSSGGEAITMKSRIPLKPENASFVGGNVISYILAKNDGVIVQAGTFPSLARLNYKLSGDSEPNFKEISLPSNSSSPVQSVNVQALTNTESGENQTSNKTHVEVQPPKKHVGISERIKSWFK